MMESRCDRGGEPGVAGEGVTDGVAGADVMATGGGEVGAHAQVVAGGVGVVPVPRDGLMPLGALECLFRGVVRPWDFEVLCEQPDLFGLVLEPLGEGVSGVL